MSNFKPLVKIVNVVATVTLPHKLDLEAISNAFPFVEYHHESFQVQYSG